MKLPNFTLETAISLLRKNVTVTFYTLCNKFLQFYESHNFGFRAKIYTDMKTPSYSLDSLFFINMKIIFCFRYRIYYLCFFFCQCTIFCFLIAYTQMPLMSPQALWGSGENVYFFSGSWGALLIILRDLGSKLFGDLGSPAKK